jgi:hypothetical protein
MPSEKVRSDRYEKPEPHDEHKYREGIHEEISEGKAFLKKEHCDPPALSGWPSSVQPQVNSQSFSGQYLQRRAPVGVRGATAMLPKPLKIEGSRVQRAH